MNETAPPPPPFTPFVMQALELGIGLGLDMGVHRVATVDDGRGIPMDPRLNGLPPGMYLAPGPGVVLYGLWRVGQSALGLVFHERTIQSPDWRQIKAPGPTWPRIPLMAVGARPTSSAFEHNRKQRTAAMRAFLEWSGQQFPRPFHHPEAARLLQETLAGLTPVQRADAIEILTGILTPKGKNGRPLFAREAGAISQPLWKAGVLDREVVSLACRLYPQQHISLGEYLMAERHQHVLRRWVTEAPRLMGVLPAIPTERWGDPDLFAVERWLTPCCPTQAQGFRTPEAARWWLQAPNGVVRHSTPQLAEVLFWAGLPDLPDAAQALMVRLLAHSETRNRFGLPEQPGDPFPPSEAAALKWVAALLPDAAHTQKEHYRSLGHASSRQAFQGAVFQAYSHAVCHARLQGERSSALDGASVAEVLGVDHPWTASIAAVRLERAVALPEQAPAPRRMRM